MMPVCGRRKVSGMAKARELPHVLLVYQELIPSVRLCGHSQMEALAAMERIAYRHCAERQLTQEALRWADIVLLGRVDDSFSCRVAARLRMAGKYLIYILDDDLFHIPEGITSAKHYWQPSVQHNIREIIGLSHAILSPSPLLLEKYAVDGRIGLLTREPTVAPVPYAPHDPAAPVRIGFAGSVDRAADVRELLGEALAEIKRVYGEKVQIEFFGFKNPLSETLNATARPYCSSYDDYRASLNEAAWDIGLAPMPDTPFHACKHYNKFVEYAAAGIVGVFSDVEPYAQLKRDIGLGLFCENRTEAWIAAIRELIDDREKLEVMRRQVCECAVTTVSAETIALALEERMAEIWPWRAPKNEKAYPLLGWKLLMRVERVGLAIKVYRWKIFSRALDKLRGRG